MKDDDLKEFESLGLDEVVPAPTHMQQRWHDSIDLAAHRERATEREASGSFNGMSFFWGAAITAALALAIGIGVTLMEDPATVDPGTYTVQEPAVPTPDRSDVFARVLQVHLRDTHASIAALPENIDQEQAALVLQIIQQNRLFEQAAERNDSDNLARVLRAFEPILLQLAATDIAPEDAAALREQLAFQLRIMLTKLERDTSKDTVST